MKLTLLFHFTALFGAVAPTRALDPFKCRRRPTTESVVARLLGAVGDISVLETLKIQASGAIYVPFESHDPETLAEANEYNANITVDVFQDAIRCVWCCPMDATRNVSCYNMFSWFQRGF